MDRWKTGIQTKAFYFETEAHIVKARKGSLIQNGNEDYLMPERLDSAINNVFNFSPAIRKI
jgi:hypothetical protein